jgi:tRNA G46 methylase TrmB
MSARVDLYDNAYANYGSEVYQQIRTETYGQDLGQTSWVTTEESNEIPRMLHLQASSSVLEIGCGSGGYALHLAKTVGCSIVGLDVNAPGVHNAINSRPRAASQHAHTSSLVTPRRICLSRIRHLTRSSRAMFCATFRDGPK